MNLSRIERAMIYIQENLNENLTLTQLVDEFGLSYYHLCRLFRQAIGVTPHQYLVQQRVELAKALLEQTDLTILDIAIECGFANPSHFAKCFRNLEGVSPKQFRLNL